MLFHDELLIEKHLPDMLTGVPILQFVLSITFCPFNIIYRSSRFFLIRCAFHCVCAPLYKVARLKKSNFIFTDKWVKSCNKRYSSSFFYHVGHPPGFLLGRSTYQPGLIFRPTIYKYYCNFNLVCFLINIHWHFIPGSSIEKFGILHLLLCLGKF